MAVAQQIVAGVGTRYGVIFPLNTDGIPNVASSSATPTQGTLIHGIKDLTITDPEPRRITHSGNDQPLAQDSLPALQVGSFGFQTSAVNLELDNTVEGTKTRTHGNNVMRAGNSDKRGNEPLVMAMIYQQALDYDPDSPTFGKLRQWHWKNYPSARVSPISRPFGEAETNKVYAATPTPVKDTPWGESLSETNWGATRAEYIEGNSNYQPRINLHMGNGTLTSFALSHPPADDEELVVFNTTTGAELTPTSINTSSQFPSFTLGSAVANNAIILSFIGTDEPGES